jgi:SNF family Na+-dependent transporter
MGSGALTAYGSYFNRSSDAIGIGVLAVFICSLGQCLMFLAFALGQHVIHPGQVAANQQDLWGPMAVGAVLANVGWPAWWSAIMTAIWFISLGSFLLVALLALIEAVASPLVDKFRVGRERVVPGICLTVFFICALVGQKEQVPAWALDGLFAAMVLTAMIQALVAWRVMKLEAIARHLNAYSAFRLRFGWRCGIAVGMPIICGLLLAYWSFSKHELLISVSIVSIMMVMAVVITRLHGRNG